MYNWIKKGLIHQANPSFWWSKKYASIPTPFLIDKERIRIYYYSTTDNFDGRISYVDVSAHNPSTILYVHPEPILDIGEPGSFDDCGVCSSSIIFVNNQYYLYYFGVQRTEKLPYLYFAGLALSNNGHDFKKVSSTPILERSNLAPHIRSATAVLFEDDIFKMWYVSGSKWIDFNGKKTPSYVIRYALSDDGIVWNDQNTVCIDFKNSHEFGFGRPWIIKENGLYKLYYSIRSKIEPYKIGYADSIDGINWNRKDEQAHIPRSESGWDSEMICYPGVLNAHNKTYLFYNGNQHGLSGFGYAELEK